MIKPLTSFRFVFALMVFLHHLSFLANSSNQWIRRMYVYIFDEGYIGVSFFFILSGFILAFNYQKRLLESTKSINRFVIARIARIYPLHLITMIMAIPLLNGIGMCCNGSEKIIGLNLLWNTLMLHGFFPVLGKCCYLNGPSWSISVEFFFYLSFPLLVFLTRKFLANYLSSILMMIGLFVLILMSIQAFGTELPDNFFYVNPIVRTADFLFGICLFNIYDRFKDSDLKINFTFIEVSSVIIFVGFFSAHMIVPQTFRYSIYYWPPVCLLILSFAFQKGMVSKLLSCNWMIILGELSFAFYLTHQLVLRYMETLWPYGQLTEINRVVIAFSISLFMSYVSLRFFELPVNRYIKESARITQLTKPLSELVYGQLTRNSNKHSS
jgi:peptidoglycan/LPS O-acetylase OafA/YrhL